MAVEVEEKRQTRRASRVTAILCSSSGASWRASGAMDGIADAFLIERDPVRWSAPEGFPTAFAVGGVVCSGCAGRARGGTGGSLSEA